MKRLRIVLLLCCLLVFVFACSVFEGGNSISFDKISYAGKTTLDNIDDMYPAALLSPDGTKILFANMVEICIYDVEAEDNDCREFGDEFRPDLHYGPVWSSDSRYLVMTEPAFTNIVDADIWVYDTQDEDLNNLTDDNYEGRYIGVDEVVEVDFFPRWVSDSEIMFMRYITGEDNREFVLFKVDISGDQTEVYDTGLEIPPSFYELSADGSKFVYAENGAERDYYLVDINSGEEDRIAKDVQAYFDPQFTPDQEYVVMIINPGVLMMQPDILTFIPIDGSGEEYTYSVDETVIVKTVSLSPDSQGVVLLQENRQDNETVLLAIDLEGNTTELKSFDERFRLAGSSFDVVWSEQNTFLVFNMDEGTYQLIELAEE